MSQCIPDLSLKNEALKKRNPATDIGYSSIFCALPAALCTQDPSLHTTRSALRRSYLNVSTLAYPPAKVVQSFDHFLSFLDSFISTNRKTPSKPWRDVIFCNGPIYPDSQRKFSDSHVLDGPITFLTEPLCRNMSSIIVKHLKLKYPGRYVSIERIDLNYPDLEKLIFSQFENEAFQRRPLQKKPKNISCCTLI